MFNIFCNLGLTTISRSGCLCNNIGRYTFSFYSSPNCFPTLLLYTLFLSTLLLTTHFCPTGLILTLFLYNLPFYYLFLSALLLPHILCTTPYLLLLFSVLLFGCLLYSLLIFDIMKLQSYCSPIPNIPKLKIIFWFRFIGTSLYFCFII